MSSSNVPPFIDEHLKPVDDVKRREELEQMASKLYALKKDKCDEPKKDEATEVFCTVFGNASTTCENAAAEKPVTKKSYTYCKGLYKNAKQILKHPKEMIITNFANYIPAADHEYEDDFEESDEEYEEDFEESDDVDEYTDDFDVDTPIGLVKGNNHPKVYSIELVKGKHANNNDYFKRLTPSKLEGLIQLDQLKIEGDKATLGPFQNDAEMQAAVSELFDNEKYHKLPNGKWRVGNKTVSETSDDHLFLKMERVSVVDKTTESVLARATRQGGKTRNRRHRRKSAKSSSKRIPRVVTKKHRRNRKTRKGKRKEKK